MCHNNLIPFVDKNNVDQIIEIKNINFFLKDECIKNIRKYETEKKKIINIGYNIINNIKYYIF